MAGYDAEKKYKKNLETLSKKLRRRTERSIVLVLKSKTATIDTTSLTAKRRILMQDLLIRILSHHGRLLTNLWLSVRLRS